LLEVLPRLTRQQSILVVDDDANFRTFVSALIGHIGFAVVEVADGEAALAVAREQRPAAVILDVCLPSLSGYEVCRGLRDLFGNDLPIVFVSGNRVEALDRAAGMLVGGDDYLVKPFDPDELLARFRRLLERGGVAPRAATDAKVDLTQREIEVLQLVAEGLRPAEIAKQLVISPKTVASHVQRILARLGVHTRAQAVAVAYEAGVIRVSREPSDTVGHTSNAA
jgi:two-component system nitrate/nitrite response regulator NarL